MLGFCNYNFMGDKNCLDMMPSNIDNINEVKLTNGIYNHYHMTSNITEPYNSNYPTTWDFMTIMDANFNGNISAGNVDFILSNISKVKIKKRIKGEFEWTTLKSIDIHSVQDLSIAFNDNLNCNNLIYEYAYVPIMGDIEGNYFTHEILSQFQGVFLCDENTIYKFYSGISYDTISQTQQIATFEPYGKKYPIVVSNGVINYAQGNLNARILPTDFLNNGNLNRFDIKKETDSLFDFITNKKSKILKDWNGNYWLIQIIGSPNVNIDVSTGMTTINSQWVEQGDPKSQSDLVSTGILEGFK